VSSSPAIVWYRSDLRVADHGALRAATESGLPVLACFVFDEEGYGELGIGGASRWWLHHSLSRLSEDLTNRGAQLVLRRGTSIDVLCELAAQTGACELHTSASPEPAGAQLEADLRRALARHGVALHCHPGALLFGPGAVRTQTGKPFQVFTPFWKACLKLPDPGAPLTAPPRIHGFSDRVDSERLDDWGLLPRQPNWADGFEEAWQPGEAGAQRRLEAFIADGMTDYPEYRDRPDREGTSCLSAHLHFGELSPRQVWHIARSAMAVRARARSGGDGFLRQLGWREFSHYLLHHWPTLPRTPFRPEFAAFPWRDDAAFLERWQQGSTGYPIVDAGMRQLWRMGWMHNRVRMVVASFLVKHLLLPWQWGAAWFWDTLVDADLANNSASWQWVAGSGADAAPYFRIFNPMLQGRKFDPDGDYVRVWVPELAALPSRHIHEPWSAPDSVLDAAGVELGRDYPLPIVDHAAARERALAAYAKIKK
jgi:deoxyribodipyrimidine photo-lyase